MELICVLVYHPIKISSDNHSIIIIVGTIYPNQRDMSRSLKELNKKTMVKYFKQEKYSSKDQQKTHFT